MAVKVPKISSVICFYFNSTKKTYKNVELHVVSVIEASHAQICDVIGEERNKERRDSD
jgi:hypothetical protein